ncbi:hypothetical protein RRV45_20070 [Bacillus sp. DTU_2020_1000418_1_SI_GHA_SEK_038]|uniref:hypothetical protein n=1 Tax=Bacillus sp. DTU_2020_1000418_1_SI_GHA_SEK_038 TaxID=3077585 RepID=UPI0028EEC7BD|nr:hypothetical protein [Bacillus sp. DTU_2020_1000418_1_SI_GHA_SEK_038]WNS75147.1 hypothetical protein RRV45_20070 [Bacillus sp. DTU_2020_1000418_1_SI_GHA_SEK_038]
MDERPIEVTGNQLDVRNTITGPDEGKGSFPRRPQNVEIQKKDSKPMLRYPLG